MVQLIFQFLKSPVLLLVLHLQKKRGLIFEYQFLKNYDKKYFWRNHSLAAIISSVDRHYMTLILGLDL